MMRLQHTSLRVSNLSEGVRVSGSGRVGVRVRVRVSVRVSVRVRGQGSAPG